MTTKDNIITCCACGNELTEKENNDNLTYDIKERVCDKCLIDLKLDL